MRGGRGKAGKEGGDGEEGEEGEEADGREERKTQELTTAAPTKKWPEKKQLDQETHTTREGMLHWDEMLTVMVYPNDNGQSGCRKD